MKSALIIIDGAGLNSSEFGNAVTPKTLPFLFEVMNNHGYAVLKADGEAVGIENGQVGNSEVGHLTIGAGKVVLSMLSQINQSFQDGSWSQHPIWQSLESQPRQDCSSVHIIGLLSDAGVHGHWRSIAQTAQLAVQKGIRDIIVHPVLDGNDSVAGTAPEFLKSLVDLLQPYPQVRLGLVMGRKWFCDRSGNLELTQVFVDALCKEQDHPTFTWESLAQHLKENPSEVTFPPHLYPGGRLCQEWEAVIHTSHRADRAVQVGRLISKIRPFFSLIHLEGASIPEQVFFETKPLDTGLAFTCRRHGVNPLRIAEQCKFPHVTYFMNGFNADLGETSICIDSIPDAQIPHQPAMSLEEVTDRIIEGMNDDKHHAIVANLANMDQVGHTGQFDSALQAADCINQALEHIAAVAQQKGWTLLFTADHGNADQMKTPDGNPFGSHTVNPVPLAILPAPGIEFDWVTKEGGLANVAASYLTTLNVSPEENMSPSLLQWREAEVEDKVASRDLVGQSH